MPAVEEPMVLLASVSSPFKPVATPQHLTRSLPAAGLDFPFVRHPFQPNSGRKKISDL